MFSCVTRFDSSGRPECGPQTLAGRHLLLTFFINHKSIDFFDF